MSRIIIQNDSSKTDKVAMFAVMTVMNMGKISNDRIGLCYCHAKVMKNDIAVYAKRNAKSYTFVVVDEFRELRK